MTGATVTSSAIKTDVNMAIEETGASPAVLPEGYAGMVSKFSTSPVFESLKQMSFFFI